jgi:hypothetical protein
MAIERLFTFIGGPHTVSAWRRTRPCGWGRPLPGGWSRSRTPGCSCLLKWNIFHWVIYENLCSKKWIATSKNNRSDLLIMLLHNWCWIQVACKFSIFSGFLKLLETRLLVENICRICSFLRMNSPLKAFGAIL